MAIDKEVLDQLLAGGDPQELFYKDGLLDEVKKALRDCQEFRVRTGITGKKEPGYVSTQRACDTE